MTKTQQCASASTTTSRHGFHRQQSQIVLQLHSLFIESRPPVQFVFVLRFIASSRIVIAPSFVACQTLFGWSMITIAIYVYNGVSDVAADTANKSRRPIATGHLSVRAASRWCWVLGSIGLTSCAFVGWPVLAAASAFAILGWAYSSGRGLKANAVGAALIIGSGAALTYVAGALVASGPTDPMWVLLVIACWVSIACSSKDFSDRLGDTMAGRGTLPVVLGVRGAALLLATASAALSTTFLACSCDVGSNSVPLAAVLMAGTVVFGWRLVVVVHSVDTQPRTAYKTYMGVQYLINTGLAFGIL